MGILRRHSKVRLRHRVVTSKNSGDKIRRVRWRHRGHTNRGAAVGEVVCSIILEISLC